MQALEGRCANPNRKKRLTSKSLEAASTLCKSLRADVPLTSKSLEAASTLCKSLRADNRKERLT